MYAYDFVGRRYDVGDKQGYLEAMLEYALRRPEMREKFLHYLQEIVKWAVAAARQGVAATLRLGRTQKAARGACGGVNTKRFYAGLTSVCNS